MNSAQRQNLSQVFRDEAYEQLDELNQSILQLETSPAPQLFEAILRTAHSLKGGAKLVGAASIEKVTHCFETLMVEIRELRVAPDRVAIDTLLDAIDSIRNELGGVAHDSGRDPDTVSGRLLKVAASGPQTSDFSSQFPGIPEETVEFLTESQKSSLLVARRNQNSVTYFRWEVSAEQLVQRYSDFLQSILDLGAVTGFVPIPTPEKDKLVFDILITSVAGNEPNTDHLTDFTLTVKDPFAVTKPPGPPELKVVSAAEDEFSREMARLLEQYITEQLDTFDEFSKDILNLDREPKDPELIHSLFRRAHSLKGTGTSFGLPAITELSHEIETVLDAVRSGKIAISSKLIDVLLRGCDGLKDIFTAARSGNTSKKAPEALLSDLKLATTGNLAPQPTPEPAKTIRPTPIAEPSSSRESIRVRLEKLDRMVNLASELTLDKNARETLTKELARINQRYHRLHWRWLEVLDRLSVDTAGIPEVSEKLGAISGEWHDTLKSFDQDLGQCTMDFIAHSEKSASAVYALQSEVLRIRMVPISLLFDNAPRLVRDLTRDGKKQVSLLVRGAGTELDKRVLEQMSDPLIHLIRNAVDHGIEPSSERTAAGKPARGTIELSAEQRGSHILISIRDDGRGIDPQRVLAKAKAMGLNLPKAAELMTAEDTYPLIFLPGFSTKDAVTEISGRGVGMDVVKKNIENLKGEISIESEIGKGTTFQIFLPVSLAVIQAVLVSAGGHDLYFPTDSVVEIAEIAEEEFKPIDGKPTINRRNTTIPLESLAKIFGSPENRPSGMNRKVVFVQGVVRGRREVFGFIIDLALEEHSIVLKEPNRYFRHVPHMAGVTIRPDGSVAMVLDATSLISFALQREGGGWTPAPALPKTPARKFKLLVCDDTHTSRELFRTLLETAGYQVVMAKNGKEGFATVEKGGIDLVVSDIQMPEMDGYELVSKIKSDARFKNTPVVLVSSLSKEEEKLRGLQAGANAYIVKGSFDQNNLISSVEGLLG